MEEYELKDLLAKHLTKNDYDEAMRLLEKIKEREYENARENN